MSDVVIPRTMVLFNKWYYNNTVIELETFVFHVLHTSFITFTVTRRLAISYIFRDQNKKFFIIPSCKTIQHEKFVSVKLDWNTKESNLFDKL